MAASSSTFNRAFAAGSGLPLRGIGCNWMQLVHNSGNFLPNPCFDIKFLDSLMSQVVFNDI
jgi:hypothetical protein